MKVLFILLAVTLTACQAWPPRAPESNRPPPVRGAGASAGSSGSQGATASGGGEEAGMGSHYGICEMQRRIAKAPTEQARQAIIQQMMPDMSEGERQQHLQMMKEECP